MGESLGVGIDIGVEDQVHQPAVVMQQLLHFGIHAGTLGIVGLRAGGDEQLIEARIFPERFVPHRFRRIGGGEHPVASRPADPVRGEERLLEPDIVPVAVIGLPDHIQVEPGRPGMLLPEESGVGRTREGGIRDRQVELGVLGPRLLEEALDHVGVVDVLRLRIDRELDGRCDRIVVADGAVAEKHLLHDLVAIERVLDRIAHIGIVEGRLLDVHDIDVVAVARRLRDHEIGVLLQNVERLQIAAIHVVDLAGVERVGARRHID